MATYIRFGNGTIDQIEKSLGIEFTEDDLQLLQETHSAATEFTGPRQWHLFTHPNVITFSSKQFFSEFRKMLRNYKLNGNLSATFETWEDESVDYHFRKDNQNVHESGFPKFLVRDTIEWDKGSVNATRRRVQFLQLAKVNPKTIAYMPVGHKGFYKDILKIDDYLSWDHAVPKSQNESQLKDSFKENSYSRAIISKDRFDVSDSSISASKGKFDGYIDISSSTIMGRNELVIVKEWRDDWNTNVARDYSMSKLDVLLRPSSAPSEAKNLVKEFRKSF